MDFIVTGRLLGAKLLGFYQFSYNLPYLVKSYVQDGIVPIAFPVFSKVQHDNERLARGFLNGVKYISMLTFPIMFGMAFCAEDFISVVYGARWLPAAGPLKLLCFGAALASVHSIVFSLFNAKGRPDIGLKWGLFRLPATVILVIVLSKYGIIGIAWAMLLVEFFTVATAFFATKLLDTYFTKYLSSIFPATISSTAMIVCLSYLNRYVVGNYDAYARLLTNTLIGFCTYSISLKMFHPKDMKQLYNFIVLCVKR
jgi:O-antigen/teichoic acid export membrane protein